MAKKQKKQVRPKQKRGLKTHEKLILSATKLLVQANLGGLRFSQLSKISGIPQSLIDYHFPSMEALHMAIIQRKIQQILDFTLESLEKHNNKPKKVLEAYIKVPFQFAKRDKEFTAVWTAYYHLISTNSAVAVFNNSVQKNGHERIVNMIRGIIVAEGGRLVKGADLDDLARQIHGIIIGYTLMAVTTQPMNHLRWQAIAIKSSFEILNSGLED